MTRMLVPAAATDVRGLPVVCNSTSLPKLPMGACSTVGRHMRRTILRRTATNWSPWHSGPQRRPRPQSEAGCR
eukprot:CAMPEP_0115344706 /NCGR_PEP_ID=MMETSP0270-20121206/93425_1 /TAXON_ID=71861 /ORGANISM="Scrippsiella trochoidea, Strain CCMP3099" /LENGTH=72 /DNA_ID=CAMNT_0002766449 /DNA_START=20 /DNA_END=235 /DNA_ORIENTATION=-